MSGDERKKVTFYTKSMDWAMSFRSGVYLMTWTAQADVVENEFSIWRDKLNGPAGLTIYESDGILQEALAAVQTELEKEQQRARDLERDRMALVAEHDQELAGLRKVLSEQAAELQRLRKLDEDLTAFAVLAGVSGGTIGP
jgi:hypothetical protein